MIAVLFSVTLPVTLVDTLGVKETVKLFVCAGASVKGTVSPLIRNPVPLAVALEMVRLPLPVFFSKTVCEFVVPTATGPKLKLDGVADIVPVPLPPVPLNEYRTLLFVALLRYVT